MCFVGGRFPLLPNVWKWRFEHPVYKDGNICLDVLQKNWSATFTVSGILTSIQSLLDEPNPDSPANSEAARLFEGDRVAYERRVLACVEASWVHSGS